MTMTVYASLAETIVWLKKAADRLEWFVTYAKKQDELRNVERKLSNDLEDSLVKTAEGIPNVDNLGALREELKRKRDEIARLRDELAHQSRRALKFRTALVDIRDCEKCGCWMRHIACEAVLWDRKGNPTEGRKDARQAEREEE